MSTTPTVKCSPPDQANWTLELLTALDDDDYRLFLLDHPNTLLYASPKYRNFLAALLECDHCTYLIRENTEITGALPLMSREGRLGRVYNSLPYYGSNGGIIAKTSTAAQALILKYNETVTHGTVAAATLVVNPWLDVDYGGLAHDLLDSRLGQFTPLRFKDECGKDLKQSFHQKTRNMIRKAQKNNITVTVNNDAVAFLHSTHVENMMAIEGKAKSARFFSMIDEYFEKDVDYRIYIAYLNGEMIAAALLFYFNKTVEYFTPVIKEQYRSIQPLSLIIYHAMVDAAARGYQWWNWGGTWKTQEGVYRFKSRWNTVEMEYQYYIKINQPCLYFSSKALLSEYDNFYVIPFHLLPNS